MMSNKRKRILVAGGAGFIGSHLCESLLADGHAIVCVDNLSSGNEHNLSHLHGNPWFEFIHHDVILPLHIEVDEIYNLACPASPRHYQEDPIQTIKTCIFGAVNLLDLAVKFGCRILQASTSEVYGDPLQHPQREQYWGNVNPIGPRACYDEGKRCAEALFFDYHRQYGVEIKVSRIFNTYGPRMHPNDGRVISNFIVQTLSGQNITIYGNGQQSRSFCYVDDLVSGLRRMMASSPEVTGPINLGSTDERTISYLACRIAQLAGMKVSLKHTPCRVDDPRHRRPDLTLAENTIGWDPIVDLDTGLSKTIAYFRSILLGDPGEYMAITKSVNQAE
ncbi:UDP-glucuronic acid decarboxylase family protein [Roseibium aggregatum]|uniref:UDP-glucuronic acid decarboxylase family protein n=1 Tax=Roseibium aggregatum TaxID=187304 RepID=UPI0025ACF60B|nr:UDP-glucuronic acid decarboxylase family protein [Roseibium aggregatum]WJS05579.1 SDR family oxidoreductase [Roseibium aggregatum]